MSGIDRLRMAQALRGKPSIERLSGSELRSWRASLELTQIAFAERLRSSGYQATERGVRRWETEENRVPQWLSALHQKNPSLQPA